MVDLSLAVRLRCRLSVLHFSTVPLELVDLGKEWCVKIGPCDFLNRQRPLLELPRVARVVLALCRLTLGGKRHRYANVLPDKFETDPMAVGGVDRCRRRKQEGSEEAPNSARAWRTNELMRDGMERPNLSRGTEFSGVNGDRKKYFFLLSGPQAGFTKYLKICLTNFFFFLVLVATGD